MTKQIFVVKVCWKIYAEHRIAAETKEQAAEIVLHERPVPDEETGKDDAQILEVIAASDPMESGELP